MRNADSTVSSEKYLVAYHVVKNVKGNDCHLGRVVLCIVAEK